MPTVIVQDRTRTVIVVQDNPKVTLEQIQRPVEVIQHETPVTITPGRLRGPQGLPGPAAGNVERLAAAILSGHRIVRSLTATTVEYADSTDASHGDDTLGLTLNAAALGDPVTVQREGSITFAGWSWTPLAPVFLSAAGAMTQVPPEAGSGHAFSQIVGFAESADTLFIDPQPPIYL